MSPRGCASLGPLSRSEESVGASLRYVVQSSFDTHSGPYATITVNLLGSLLLGMMFGAMSAGMTVSEGVSNFGDGGLGSFTTMSAFAMDYVEFSDSSITSAIVYVSSVTIIGEHWIGNGWISCNNGNTVIDVFRAPTVE